MRLRLVGFEAAERIAYLYGGGLDQGRYGKGKCKENGSQSMDSEAAERIRSIAHWLRSGSVWEGQMLGK